MPTSSAALLCAHCGAHAGGSSTPAFCCQGCQTVYGILSAASLTDYYRLRAQSSGVAAPVPKNAAYSHFDHAVFGEAHVTPRTDGYATCELYLENVHCAACVWLVEKLPRLVEGVESARLSLATGVVEVVYKPNDVLLSAIAGKLADLGYSPHPYTDAGQRSARLQVERRMLVRLGICGAVFGNVMLVALALYSGAFGGMSGEHAQFFRWVSLILTLPAMVVAAQTFFRGALAALRTGAPHMDLPITLALTMGFAWGTANTLRGVGDVYFDTITTLIFLLLISRWLQLRHSKRASDAAAIMHAVAPHSARLYKDGDIADVPSDAVVPGDVVEVRAGDRVPVDGVVVEGNSSLDTSFLTGESMPVHVAEGCLVLSGATCVDGRLLVRAQKTGRTTRLGELVRAMERIQSQRSPIVRMADRMAGVFTVVVLALAVLTCVVWLWRGADWSLAVDHTVALLIVTCPCALGMATPLAMSVALQKAARLGLFIKGGDTLERLSSIQRVVFDKTGTLTQGQPRVCSMEGDPSVLPRVAALEALVVHPLARALVRACPDTDLKLDVQGVKQTTGGGVAGLVDNNSMLVGSAAFVRTQLGALPDWIEASCKTMAEASLTSVVVAQDSVAVLVLGIGDEVRDDAQASLHALGMRGLQLEMASGDDVRVAKEVGARVGLASQNILAGLSPEQKVALVQDTARSQPTMMVGDGVNDALALGAAWVGVAVHGGAEASLSAADVYVARPGVAAIAQILDGAERTVRLIKRNIALSLAYNAVAVALALAGVLTPLVAALLMPLSSLTVVTSSLKASTFREAP